MSAASLVEHRERGELTDVALGATLLVALVAVFRIHRYLREAGARDATSAVDASSPRRG